MTVEEHPFSRFIKILGKGKNGMRSLTQDEAYEAMSMFARYEVEPEQLGAFMSLIRVKEETPEELAGFTLALRDSFTRPGNHSGVMIDWPAYAGKRKHMPWFVLAAILLGRNGYPVLMHGLKREDDRFYADDALEALGIEDSKTLSSAQIAIKETGFAYIRIGNLSQITEDLMQTRVLLGLRSPVNTVVRMLNPLSAPLMMQGVFHPNYAQVHQQAGIILGQSSLVAFRGEGGEAERMPDRKCTLAGISNDRVWDDEWPALMSPGKYEHDHFPDIDHFLNVWEGHAEDVYAWNSIVGTIGLVLRALGISENAEEAIAKGIEMWNDRLVTGVDVPKHCSGR